MNRRTLALTVGGIVLASTAFGGGATAARMITGRDIVDNSVAGIDIRDNSLTSKDVRNRSLGNHDLHPGSIRLPRLHKSLQALIRKGGPAGARGPAGPAGPAGARGPAGPAGAVGPAGQNSIAAIYTAKPTASIVNVTAGQTATTTATCNSGYVALGGGFTADQAGVDSVPVIYKSGFAGVHAQGMFNAWEVRAKNAGTGTFNLTPYVVCAKLTG